METVVLGVVATLVTGFLAGGAAFGLRSWLGSSRQHDKAWKAAVRRAALAGLEESSEEITGWSGNLRVRLSRYWRSREDAGTRITVSGPGLASTPLSIRAETLGMEVFHRAGRHDVETGDAVFDRVVWVQGPEPMALAVLDAPTRAGLRALVRGQIDRPGRLSFWATGSLADGALEVDVPEHAPPRDAASAPPGEELIPALYIGGVPEHLPDAIEATLDLARRLAPPPDVPHRLAENLVAEPDRGVRLRLLDTLVAAFRSHPATAEALSAALADADAEVRVRAAAVLAPAARGVLLAATHGEGASDATSALAIEKLGAGLSVAEAIDVLRDALRLRKLMTSRACLQALGRRGGTEALGMLSRVLAVEREEVAEWAAEALGASDDPAAEEPLLRALVALGPRRRAAAARALGKVGTVAAVAGLRQAEEQDPGVRRAAREAIASIRARARGAEPGQLSLAEDEGGRLSYAAPYGGQLSLPPDEGSS